MSDSVPEWPAGNSTTGAAIRSKNWTDTPLGPTETWPQSLRWAVGVILGFSLPNAVFWGEDALFFYNDAWLKRWGDARNQPPDPGCPAREVLAKAWPHLGPHIRQIYSTGDVEVFEDRPFLLYEPENADGSVLCRYTLHPVRCEDDSVSGVFLQVDYNAHPTFGQHLGHRMIATEIGSWDWDARTNRVTWSASQEALYGLQPGEFDGSFDTFLQAVHPDDRHHVMTTIDRTLEQKTRYRIEHRVVRKNGEVIWLEARGQVIQDEEGKVLGMTGTAFNITQRKQAEERLRDSEEHFRLAVEAARLGTWRYDSETDLMQLDERMQAIWGDARSEIPVPEMMERVHPQDLTRVQQAIDDALDPASDGQYTAEYRILWDDGTVRWLSENGQAQFLGQGKHRRAVGGFGTALDITDRKRSELRDRFMAQLNQELQPIEDPGQIMATTARLLGEHLEADRCAFAQVEGDNHFVITSDYTRGDMPSLVGRWALASFGEEAIRRVNSNQPDAVEDILTNDRFTDKDREAYGRIKVRAKMSVPLHKEGRYTAGMTVHQRTPRRWLPEEVELVRMVTNRCWEALERARLLSDLKAMNETLEKRVQERTVALQSYQGQLRKLAAKLSQAEEHERQRLATELHDHLGQLLTMCKMKLDLLQRQPPSEQSSRMGDVSELMDEAIRYTRELMSELKPPPSLGGEDLVAAMRWLADTKKKKYGLEVIVKDDGLPKALDEDVRSTLIQCARELLFNVVKHGQVDKARVTLSRRGDQVHLSVADKGKGFEVRDPEQVLPTKEGGFGLFSIRERMAWMGGHLDLSSEPGRGTEAILTVPVKDAAQTETEQRVPRQGTSTAPPVSPSSPGPDAKIRILLADDHQMVRTGLRKIIEEEEDLQVVAEASDGQESVQLAREYKPDVVIMDVNMPVMNGIDATRLITAEAPHIRVIGLSLHDQKNVTQAMRNAGASAYLTKSEVYETLCVTIRSEAHQVKQTGHSNEGEPTTQRR